MKSWLRIAGMLVAMICLLAGYLFWADFDTDEVIVAVLDTGVDPNHPLLEGKVINGVDFASRDFDTSDPDGHGTHVAGIIAQEAPEAKILSVRVIAEDDDVRNSAWAVLYSVMRGADVINMSYVEPYSKLTEWAIAYGKSKGVIFVASSGNQGKNQISYPSKYDGVYSVAAFDPDNGRVFGNISEKVRYLAPGINIRSAALDGGYTNKSGTSMSAGYISGVIAYIHTLIPDIQPEELDQLLELASLEVESHEVTPGLQGHVFRIVDFDQVKTGLSRLQESGDHLVGIM